MMGAGIFVLLQGRKKLNVLYFFLALTLLVYEMSLVIAPLMPTYELAYTVWLFNIVDVFITAVIVHFMFAIVGLDKRFRFYIRTCYGIASLLFAATIVYPHLFLPEVLPKLYFPWYLDAGPLYVIMFVFFLAAPLFPFIKLVQASRNSPERNKIEYFIFMFALGYGIGSWNFALVFDYQIDPLFGSPLWITILPVAYGIVADRLFDIRLVLKRALAYSVSIGAITAVLSLLIFLNDLLVESIPWVQFWTVPIFTSAIAFFIGRSIWLKLAENERVKYEFITVATHKLRTPLTQISWGVRQLLDETKDEATKQLAQRIQQSSNRLIELTNIIFETTQEDTLDYTYTKEKVGLVSITKTVLYKLDHLIKAKKLNINLHVDEEVYVLADPRRIESVVEVLLENAVNYSVDGGFIQILAYEKRGNVFYSVTDSGIGVSSSEKSHIFSRFYRTDAAKRADTEGVGLGLAMAKSIIEKHKGKIGVESQGEGKGSTFWFSLPQS